MNRFVVISGCSGGGKSTLLGALQRRGFNVVEEPGRRIVRQELAGDGAALPWVDLAAFARRAIEMAIADRGCAISGERWTFFDRGLVDAAVALDHATGEAVAERLNALHPYHRQVFMTPPWPDLHVMDGERQASLEAAIAEYERLCRAYPALGYEVIEVPRMPVEARADFVLGKIL